MSNAPRIVEPQRPKSRLGTPAHTGPYAKLRLDTTTKLEQGEAVYELLLAGHSIRSAARSLGLSRMTAWRRAWFLHDFAAGGGDPVPHQRSTRAVPRGEPWLLPRDAGKLLRQLLDSGPEITPDTVVAAVTTVPRCVRAEAALVLLADRLPAERFARLEARLAARARRRPAQPVYLAPDVLSELNRAR